MVREDQGCAQMSDMILHNRYVFLLLLSGFILFLIIWEKYRPVRAHEVWGLPERREAFSYSEDIPEWMMRTAREDLDWGFGVGHFPEFPEDDEELERGDYTGLTPQRRVKTLMTFEILAVLIIIFLFLIIIFS